jgi:hypothetical protein
MIPDRIPKRSRAGPMRDDERASTNPGSLPISIRRREPWVAVAEIAALQRLAGNKATATRIEAGRGALGTKAQAPDVQRLDIYGRAAARATALPAATAEDFRRQVEAGNASSALGVVVAAMTARGELNARLLRTSGAGDLWQISDIGSLGAQVSFRASFPDPDDPTRRLPNPRFSVSPGILAAGRADALDRLHASLLHEFRHVEQAAERVNAPRESGAAREPGYGNDPDEFDAYLSEVESSYSATHMTTAALQAGVGWEFMSAADKVPFQARWTAAQARIRSVLGYPVEDVLRTPRAERYREQLREMARRAREAYERAGR